MKSYLTNCNRCGATTSRTYAKTHGGHCKSCIQDMTGQSSRAQRDIDAASRRQALIIDHGWDAYQREEGAYDLPDNY